MKILISNRGECALRIIRAAKQLGHTTVAIYAKGDESQLHLQDADEAICIGNAPATESYLNIDRIITACKLTLSDAIHPGYGFLSESYRMATAAELAGIKWIGPTAMSMELLSDKSKGRQIAHQSGMSIIQGSSIFKDSQQLLKISNTIGYPVLLKAANGGGGKGLRIIHSAEQWNEMFALCQRETKQAYGTDDFIVEKYLHQPKHIEVQILSHADHTYILGYRDCSLQKNHQKIIEESYFPSRHGFDTTAIEHQIRTMLHHIKYLGLGTLEFLVVDHHWHFIEMNTRMQVEHTVTECQSGIDLIQHQIQTGLGIPEPLPETTSALHAIECRINLNSFKEGNVIKNLRWPGGFGVRIDSHLYTGYQIPPHYDSMLGKIICTDTTRAKAIARMRVALAETIIDGIDHNIDQLQSLLSDSLFSLGEHHTQTITS